MRYTSGRHCPSMSLSYVAPPERHHAFRCICVLLLSIREVIRPFGVARTAGAVRLCGRSAHHAGRNRAIASFVLIFLSAAGVAAPSWSDGIKQTTSFFL